MKIVKLGLHLGTCNRPCFIFCISTAVSTSHPSCINVCGVGLCLHLYADLWLEQRIHELDYKNVT